MMKAVLFTLLFLLAGPMVSTAQTFQASLLGGLNVSQIDGDNLAGFHFLGANAGMRVVAVLGDRWRVGPEILFSQHGSRIANSDFSAFDFERIRMNTVEVPLMVYFKDWRFTAEAGFAYQRLISYQVLDLAGADITDEVPFREDLVNFQTGVTLFLKPNLGVNFRWSKSIGDIEARQDNLTLKARTLTFRLVYVLGDGETLPKAPQDE